MPMQRLGLFGGSFDPVHLGHLLLAQAAQEELRLDRLIFVPAARSPFKPATEPAPAADRLRLLRLGMAGRSSWDLDAREIERGGVSYTVDTLREYQERFPQASLFYLIGADHAPLLPQWRGASELARLATFLVIPRPGEALAAIPPPFRGLYLKGIPVGVSSSLVRERLRQGLSVDGLVPDAVAESLHRRPLYL